jgi:hypothetical protein
MLAYEIAYPVKTGRPHFKEQLTIDKEAIDNKGDKYRGKIVPPQQQKLIPGFSPHVSFSQKVIQK